MRLSNDKTTETVYAFDFNNSDLDRIILTLQRMAQQSNSFCGDFPRRKAWALPIELILWWANLIAPGPIAQATWSPDGNSIAFVSSADEIGRPPYHIAVMKEDGENIKQLTEGRVRHYSPTWSPDGKQIAFISARDYEGGGNLAIFVMNSDGSEQRQITPYVYDSDLSWSPYGSRIAYSVFNAIFVVSTDGAHHQAIRLTNGLTAFLYGLQTENILLSSSQETIQTITLIFTLCAQMVPTYVV